MSGETETNVSGWTTDTLRSLVEMLLAERDHRFEQRFTAQERALAAALEAAEKTRERIDEDSQRQAAAARDYADSQVSIIGQRIDAMDKATELLNDQMTRFPTDVDTKVGQLRELHGEKFTSVQQQFSERDTRSERESKDNKVAVDAAFAAQKEAACLSSDSPVLCADLIWRPVGDLLPGDELIAFDEDGPNRHYRRSVVTANALERDALLLVNTPLGSVRCTYNHPWLVRRHRGHAYEWRTAETLRPGDRVLRMLDVWDVDRSYAAGWLSGILDGEGCLGFKSRKNGGGKVSIGQVAGITADMIDEALKARDVAIIRHVRPQIGNAQSQRRWDINRRADVMKLLGSVRPARLLANADAVWEGFAIKGQGRLTTVTSVEGAGSGVVARLSTSTHTYIGAGFAHHNSEQNKSNTLAIDKSEKATAETLNKQADLFKSTTDGLRQQIESTTAALRDQIDDLKASLNEVRQLVNGASQNKQGGTETTAAQRANVTYLIGIVLFIITIAGFAIALGAKH